MSWYRPASDLTLAAFLTVLVLSGCGFAPLYGSDAATKTTAAQNVSSVAIGNIPDARGQYLHNALIDRFYRSGRPADPAYTLTMTPLVVHETDLGIGKDASVTRVQTEITTTIKLQDAKSNKPVLERYVRASGGHNIYAGQYATIVAKDASETQALDDLAAQIEQELALYFSRPGQKLP